MASLRASNACRDRSLGDGTLKMILPNNQATACDELLNMVQSTYEDFYSTTPFVIRSDWDRTIAHAIDRSASNTQFMRPHMKVCKLLGQLCKLPMCKGICIVTARGAYHTWDKPLREALRTLVPESQHVPVGVYAMGTTDVVETETQQAERKWAYGQEFQRACSAQTIISLGDNFWDLLSDHNYKAGVQNRARDKAWITVENYKGTCSLGLLLGSVESREEGIPVYLDPDAMPMEEGRYEIHALGGGG